MFRQCSLCEWWKWLQGTGDCEQGTCHRNAPSPAEPKDSRDRMLFILWPKVDFNDYCGEFMRKCENQNL